MGLEPTQSSTVEAADNFAQRMSQIQDEVKATLKHAVDEMAWYYDCWRSPAPVYEVRAKVWLNAQNYTTTHCRWENGPICEPPTETDLMAKACHYYHPKISNEFDT